MANRYTTEERIFGGSMEGRLNPRFGGHRLNEKLGPRWGKIHDTEGQPMQVPDPEHRRRSTGLPERFFNKRGE